MPKRMWKFENAPLVPDVELEEVPHTSEQHRALAGVNERFLCIIEAGTNRSRNLIVPEELTVSRLKEEISSKFENLPAARQRLLLRGMELENDWTVENIPCEAEVLYVELSTDGVNGPKFDVKKFLKTVHEWDEMDEVTALGLGNTTAGLEELQKEMEQKVEAVEEVKWLLEDTRNNIVLEWVEKKEAFVKERMGALNQTLEERARLQSKFVCRQEKPVEEGPQIVQLEWQSEKKEDEIAKRKKLKEEAWKSSLDKASDLFLEDLILFAMFFAVFTFIFFANRRFTDQFYYIENDLSQAFETSQYKSMTTTTDMWNYLDTDGIGQLCQDRWYNGEPLPSFGLGYVLLMSKLLGSFRIRQIRGTEESAGITGLMPSSASTLMAQDKYDYSSTSPGTGTIVKGGIVYEFQEFDGVTVEGKFESYPSSGFVRNFNPNEQSCAAIRQELLAMRAAGWTDLNTRAVLLEATLYNANEDFYIALSLLMETPKVGGVEPNPMQVNILRLNRYATPMDIAVLIFELILICIMLDFFRTQFLRIRLEGRLIFTQLWTWFDCLNLVSLWVVLALRISWLAIWKETSVNTGEYVDLSLISSIYYWDNAVNSLNGMLINMRAFKFLALWERMQLFKDTLKISIPMIMMYWLNLFVIMFAFAAAGFVAFGKHMNDYKNLISGMLTQFQMASGQFNFEGMKAQKTLLGPLLLILYAMTMYFCLVCMFMGINCYTYSVVSRGQHIGDDDFNVDGPEMIDAVKRKMLAWAMRKIPALRRHRENQAKEKREKELAHARAFSEKDDMNRLVVKFKGLVRLIGQEECNKIFAGVEFYETSIVDERQWEGVPLTNGYLEELEAQVKAHILKRDGNAPNDDLKDTEGAGVTL